MTRTLSSGNRFWGSSRSPLTPIWSMSSRPRQAGFDLLFDQTPVVSGRDAPHQEVAEINAFSTAVDTLAETYGLDRLGGNGRGQIIAWCDRFLRAQASGSWAPSAYGPGRLSTVRTWFGFEPEAVGAIDPPWQREEWAPMRETRGAARKRLERAARDHIRSALDQIEEFAWRSRASSCRGRSRTSSATLAGCSRSFGSGSPSRRSTTSSSRRQLAAWRPSARPSIVSPEDFRSMTAAGSLAGAEPRGDNQHLRRVLSRRASGRRGDSGARCPKTLSNDPLRTPRGARLARGGTFGSTRPMAASGSCGSSWTARLASLDVRWQASPCRGASAFPNATSGEPVYLTEGEKAAEALPGSGSLPSER